MDTLTGTLLAICVAAVLLLVAYKKGFLTNTGILASFISAVIIAYCGNFWWFAAYMLFPMMALVEKLACHPKTARISDCG